MLAVSRALGSLVDRGRNPLELTLLAEEALAWERNTIEEYGVSCRLRR